MTSATDNRTTDRVDHSPRVRDAIDELMRKKDATDNRTTALLREGLTERGIEWRSGLKGATFVGDWCFVEYDNGRLAATCEPVLTPEQAIAATLEDETPKMCSTCQYRYVVGQRLYPTFRYMCGFGDGKKLCGDNTSVIDHMCCEHWEKELR